MLLSRRTGGLFGKFLERNQLLHQRSNFSSGTNETAAETDPLPSENFDESVPVKLITGAELEFLGTSSACSTNTRNVSSLAFHFCGGCWLFDCGEGTVRQLISSSVRVSKIDACFITHLHGDHFYGLPGLGMKLLGLRPEGDKTRLFAPFGIRSFMGTSISSNRSFDIHELVPPSSRRAMDQSVKPVTVGSDGSYSLMENEYFSVTAVPIAHTVFCAGYVIVEKERRGSLDASRLINEFHIPPGPIYREILEGKTVRAPDGREVRPEMVVGQARPPRKIVILGDTCDPSTIAPFAEGADVLVHEATCADADRAVALSKGHSTAGMAGAFARKIKAKRLILNHFSPRGFQANEYEEAKTIRQLVLQARAAFGSEFVYAAKDFWRFPIPIPEVPGQNRPC